MLSFEQCFILFSSFPLLLAFVIGGLGFEFCVFVAGWRHALRSEWPFIIITQLLAHTSQANMADHMRRHRVRWLGHTACKPNDVMVKQLLLHSGRV